MEEEKLCKRSAAACHDALSPALQAPRHVDLYDARTSS